MRRLLAVLALAAVTLVAVPPARSAAPEKADAILHAATQQARASHRSVFLIFHASWCKWCHRLDAVLTAPDVQKIHGKYYVMTRLDVLERGRKVDSLENPGGNNVMKTFGGEKSGLPFCVVLDAKGRKLGDSNLMPDHTNIGYPGAKEELDAFGKLLKTTAPRMSAAERTEILNHFTPAS